MSEVSWFFFGFLACVALGSTLGVMIGLWFANQDFLGRTDSVEDAVNTPSKPVISPKSED